jgi:ribosomal protein S18 acetylase RimI-like enzyme
VSLETLETSAPARLRTTNAWTSVGATPTATTYVASANHDYPTRFNNLELYFIETEDALYASELDLRFRVLREPLGHGRKDVPFPFEEQCLHLVAVDGGRVVGCVLFTADEEHSGRLFQMAISPQLQGQGLGTRLVQKLELELRKRKVERLHLHARDSATAFYERLGYRCVGDPFTEVGIRHRNMEKELV